MNAGLPGTGIGGLFYIATALWMPAHRLLARRSGGGREWRRIAAQLGIAVGILVALGATGWMLAGLLSLPLRDAAGFGSEGAAAQAARIFRWVALIGTIGILAAVLLTVEFAGFVMRRLGRRTRHELAPAAGTGAAGGEHDDEPAPLLAPELADVA
jgi:hypothetical protein